MQYNSSLIAAPLVIWIGYFKSLCLNDISLVCSIVYFWREIHSPSSINRIMTRTMHSITLRGVMHISNSMSYPQDNNDASGPMIIFAILKPLTLIDMNVHLVYTYKNSCLDTFNELNLHLDTYIFVLVSHTT